MSALAIWQWIKRWALPILIIGVWAAWLFAVLLHGDGFNLAQKLGFSEFDYETAAKFGDAFGSLSSFMAALAAAGAWYAVGQARRQSFETTFYNLMTHLNQIVADTDIQGKRSFKDEEGERRRENTELYKGRDAFRRMVRNLRLTVAGTKRKSESERVIEGWKSFHDKYKNDLAHYFRTLYHIILFIDSGKSYDKELYAKILRAGLSDSEQILLMYNCSVGKGRAKFKSLVEKYSLLHNCSTHDTKEHWENVVLRPSFAPQAFRDADSETWPSPTEVDTDIESNALSALR